MEIEAQSQESKKRAIIQYLQEQDKHNWSSQVCTRQLPVEISQAQQSKVLQQDFVLQEVNYQQQYAHTYFNRLMQIKGQIKNRLDQLQEPFLEEIIQTKPNKSCILIGTISKEMKLKPSILQKLNAPTMSTNQLQQVNYMSGDDLIFLEDTTGRVKLDLTQATLKKPDGLTVPITNQFFINGIVVAVQGTLMNSNQFVVKQIFFPSLPNQESTAPALKAIASIAPSQINDGPGNQRTIQQYITNLEPRDSFVALISGTNISSVSANYTLKNLKQFLFGNTIEGPLQKFASRIEKLVIAGNFIQSSNRDEMEQALLGFKVQETFVKVQNDIKNTMIIADNHLEETLRAMPVYYMPGEQEPSTTLLPQQPIHKCYFPKSSGYADFRAVTNPFLFAEKGITFLGTSGQNIQDIKKYSKMCENDIELLELNMFWNHLAPSAPDTLKCFPIHDNDCLTVKSLPHVYFVGNCGKFQTKLMVDKEGGQVKKATRLICVPEFSTTHSIVLVNLRNLDALQVTMQP